MAVACLFTCDACGNTGLGSLSGYLCPDPPKGWIWWFGSGMRSEGPHACSHECWEKVKHSPDGKVYLPDSHERRAVKEHERMTRRPCPPPEPHPAPPPPLKRTWIYFAQRGENGPVKIGVSGNVTARVSALQTAVAEPVRLLAMVEGTRRTERELHSRFRNCRLKGEWFRPVPELLAHITSLDADP